MDKLKEIWFGINEKIRYIIIGGFNSMVSFLIFVFLIHFFADHCVYKTNLIYNEIRQHITILENITFLQFIRQFCLLLSWVLSSFVSFATQRRLVFRAKGHSHIVKQYIKCLSSWAVGYLVNAIVLELFAMAFAKSDFLSPVIETDIAQFFALGLSAISTFVLFKYFAFKKKTV